MRGIVIVVDASLWLRDSCHSDASTTMTIPRILRHGVRGVRSLLDGVELNNAATQQRSPEEYTAIRVRPELATSSWTKPPDGGALRVGQVRGSGAMVRAARSYET